MNAPSVQSDPPSAARDPMPGPSLAIGDCWRLPVRAIHRDTIATWRLPASAHRWIMRQRLRKRASPARLRCLKLRQVGRPRHANRHRPLLGRSVSGSANRHDVFRTALRCWRVQRCRTDAKHLTGGVKPERRRRLPPNNALAYCMASTTGVFWKAAVAR